MSQSFWIDFFYTVDIDYYDGLSNLYVRSFGGRWFITGHGWL